MNSVTGLRAGTERQWSHSETVTGGIMQQFTVDQIETSSRLALLDFWRELYGAPAPRGISAPMMRRMLAFDIQANAQGGLSKSFFAALKKQAVNGGTKKPPKLKDGARFVREWNGRTHIVEKIDGRYRWNQNTYRSLSAIAREVTGAHWSGPRFFGCAEARPQ